MPRKKSKLTGYGLVAGLIAAGVYFAKPLTEQFNKIKHSLTGK